MHSELGYFAHVVLFQASMKMQLLKVFSEGLENEYKVPCPRALLLLPEDSNWEPYG